MVDEPHSRPRGKVKTGGHTEKDAILREDLI